jgi:imidazolonepropionase-like amidohydrolase
MYVSELVAIEDAQIWDGSGTDPFPGTVLIEGERITAVMPASEAQVPDGAKRIDAAGRFLMPGLVEGHAHPSFLDIARPQALGETPPEDHAIATLVNAQKLLDAGFTSLCSAASAKIRVDVAVRDAINSGAVDAINSGAVPGPRMLAASPEITVTGGLGDANREHQPMTGFGLVADGAEQIRAATRVCLREGVDIVKINISGDAGVDSATHLHTVMTDDEIAAAVQATHSAGRRVAAHARSPESVKRAIHHGVNIIYHCDLADEEALNLLESAKDRIFTGPAIGIIITRIESLRGDDSARAAVLRGRLTEIFEASCITHAKMRERGIPIVIGGDYGFNVNPQGTNARDLGYFVHHFGFSPSEALQAATRIGGEIMLMKDELGLIRPGYLADLLLVDADPLADVTVLEDRSKLAMIMLGGAFRKLDL